MVVYEAVGAGSDRGRRRGLHLDVSLRWVWVRGRYVGRWWRQMGQLGCQRVKLLMQEKQKVWPQGSVVGLRKLLQQTEQATSSISVSGSIIINYDPMLDGPSLADRPLQPHSSQHKLTNGIPRLDLLEASNQHYTISDIDMGSEGDLIPAYCWSQCGYQCIHSTLGVQFGVSLVCSVLAVTVSAYHIYMHLHNFNNPFFQSKIIVILIMAPFYCLTSMGSFVFPHLQIYFTLTRDSYEAILLFVFFYLMFSYLAFDRDKNQMEDKKVYTVMVGAEKEIHHFWPVYYCQKPYQLTHWKKAKYFTYRCKKYVLQFLVIKLLSTTLMYVIYPKESSQVYDQEAPGQDNGTYEVMSAVVAWVVAVSASYSLYYLVLFYHALAKPLAPYSALLKFLTIKVTIFFTFWQRIMIVTFEQDMLACFDKEAANYSHSQIVSSLEVTKIVQKNTLICFQMLLMSIAGGIAYDYGSYVSQRARNSGNFGEVFRDTVRAFKRDFRLIKPKKFGFVTQDQVGEIELVELKQHSRMSVAVSIKSKSPIAECMVENYL